MLLAIQEPLGQSCAVETPLLPRYQEQEASPAGPSGRRHLMSQSPRLWLCELYWREGLSSGLLTLTLKIALAPRTCKATQGTGHQLGLHEAEGRGQGRPREPRPGLGAVLAPWACAVNKAPGNRQGVPVSGSGPHDAEHVCGQPFLLMNPWQSGEASARTKRLPLASFLEPSSSC